MVSVMSVPDSHMIGSDTKTLIVDTQCWNQFVQQDMYGSLVYHISCPSFLSPSLLPLYISASSLPSVVNISIAPTNVSLVEQLQQLTFQLFKEGTAVRDVQVVVSTQPNSARGMRIKLRSDILVAFVPPLVN